MLASIAIEPQLWPTSAVLDWINVLARVPRIARRDARLAEASEILRARLTFQGSTLSFSTERRDALWWLMISGDVNAVRSILAVTDVFMKHPALRAAWEEDAGRLVRGTLARQRRGHWNTTTANAWGVLALERFSATFEAAPVSAPRARSSAAHR